MIIVRRVNSIDSKIVSVPVASPHGRMPTPLDREVCMRPGYGTTYALGNSGVRTRFRLPILYTPGRAS
ncbi:hypothetical protein B0G77_4276 [Paraburkholderia sp. BL10I2N1]|nr:hypothetical protein B0G77_4276 [Paraburkholderia sp. BL10I2N1]